MSTSVERERGVEHRFRGRRVDRLHARGRRDGEIRGEQRHVGSTAPRLLGERDAHASGRAISDEAHRVDRLPRASGRDENAQALERPRREELLDPGEDLLRLCHPPHSPLALGHLALVRADKLEAARLDRGDIRARGRVRPHARVHRRRDEDRPLVREDSLREDVVGDPVGELRHRVRGQRRDHDEIEALEVRIRALVRAAPRERAERLGGHEALGAGRQRRARRRGPP